MQAQWWVPQAGWEKFSAITDLTPLKAGTEKVLVEDLAPAHVWHILSHIAQTNSTMVWAAYDLEEAGQWPAYLPSPSLVEPTVTGVNSRKWQLGLPLVERLYELTQTGGLQWDKTWWQTWLQETLQATNSQEFDTKRFSPGIKELLAVADYSHIEAWGAIINVLPAVAQHRLSVLQPDLVTTFIAQGMLPQEAVATARLLQTKT